MIERLLGRLVKALTAHRIPYMLIGGQAVLFHGHPRLTQDVDVTLGVDTDAVASVLAVCRRAGLRPLVKQPETFVSEMHVLPAHDEQSGLRVDLVFSNTLYERQAIRRACRARIGRVSVQFASLEDVIVHKLVAGRPIDVDDVRTLLVKHRGRLDAHYVRRWLKQFAALGTLPHDPLIAFNRLHRPSSSVS